MSPDCKHLHIDGSSAGFRSVLFQDNEDSTTNTNIGTIFSQWVNLTAGEYYYIEASHTVGTASHRLTVGVEIESLSGGPATHPKMKP